MLSEFGRRNKKENQTNKQKKKLNFFIQHFVHETDPEVGASPSFPFD
jgi:hypothetical protein